MGRGSKDSNLLPSMPFTVLECVLACIAYLSFSFLGASGPVASPPLI